MGGFLGLIWELLEKSDQKCLVSSHRDLQLACMKLKLLFIVEQFIKY